MLTTSFYSLFYERPARRPALPVFSGYMSEFRFVDSSHVSPAGRIARENLLRYCPWRENENRAHPRRALSRIPIAKIQLHQFDVHGAFRGRHGPFSRSNLTYLGCRRGGQAERSDARRLWDETPSSASPSGRDEAVALSAIRDSNHFTVCHVALSVFSCLRVFRCRDMRPALRRHPARSRAQPCLGRKTGVDYRVADSGWTIYALFSPSSKVKSM